MVTPPLVPLPRFVIRHPRFATYKVDRAMFEATRHATGEVSAAPGPAAALPGDRDLQRASGAGRITLRGSDRGTEVVDVYQKFPTRIMVPTIGDGALKEVVVINASGGIAGGDRLEFEVTALGNSQVTVTSQAAEKIYRALDQPGACRHEIKSPGRRETGRGFHRKPSFSIPRGFVARSRSICAPAPN